MKKTTVVTVETQSVGQSFGCCGVVRSQRTGRKLAETRLYPHGFDAAAMMSAEDLAESRGYVLAR